MTGLPLPFAVAAAAALGLAALAVLAPERPRYRALVPLLAAAALAAGGGGAWVLIGRPQPVALSLAVPPPSGFEVLFADWTEGEAIHVLARPPAGAPRLYALPWRRPLAEQLENAIAAARDDGGVLRMADVFRAAAPDLAGRIVFTAAPVAPAAVAATDPRAAGR